MKKLTLLLVAVVAMAFTSQVKGDEIVYQQNISGVSFTALGAGVNQSSEFGDSVSLAGTARHIINALGVFQFSIGDGTDYNVDVNMFLRNLDGPAGSPGSLIYSRTDSFLAPGVAAAYLYDIDLPNVLVPDNFAFMLSITRTGGNATGTVGFHLASNPSTVGFSDPNFFWLETATGSGLFNAVNFGADPRANLRLQLTAIPEPATVSTLLFGLAGLALTARKRRLA